MKQFLAALIVIALAAGATHAEFTMPAERTLHRATHDAFVQQVGAVVAFMSSTCPSGFLEANGATISRGGYSKLFAAVGVANGTGDGSTTFRIPDMRGRFIRGWDHGAANDPDRATRTADATGANSGDNVGSFQSDRFLSHNHSEQGVANNGTAGSGSSHNDPKSAGNQNTGSTGGNETRPINLNVLFCIFTGA